MRCAAMRCTARRRYHDDDDDDSNNNINTTINLSASGAR
jgi:hypothetical protein